MITDAKAFALFWLGYFVVAVICNLFCRFLEVMEYVQNNLESYHGWVSAGGMRGAWRLEYGFDTKSYVNLICTAFWPIGLFTIPFIYWSALCYTVMWPLRKMQINSLVPKWLTFESFAARLNKENKR